jgi:hypothetical protein
LAKVSDRYERARLSRFFSWCSKSGIAPTAVTQADVGGFAKALVNEMMVERPKAVHRDLALAWNRCGIGIAGWPDLEIKVPDNLRIYALPEGSFSEAFVADVNAYIKHQSVVDPFEDPPRKPLAPTTLRDLRLRIFQLGTALAEAGHDPKQFTGLRDLVAPAAAKAALSGLHQRNGGRKTGQLYNYAQTLIKIARHWGMQVEERRVSVTEVIEANQTGRLQEAFGAGTAATIAAIKAISCDGIDHELPAIETREFSAKVRKYMDDLKYGRIADEHGWNLTV